MNTTQHMPDNFYYLWGKNNTSSAKTIVSSGDIDWCNAEKARLEKDNPSYEFWIEDGTGRLIEVTA